MSHNCSVIKGGCASRSNIKGKLTVSTVIEDNTQTYVLVDEAGNEIPAVLVDEEVVLTATTNDIRLGTIAVTEAGVVTGEKFIPPYHTSVGSRIITNGSQYSIFLPERDAHNYTALQCVICPFQKSINESVSAEKVVINDKTYDVRSNVALADVTVDSENKTVMLNIANQTGGMSIIRYFTYKEET